MKCLRCDVEMKPGIAINPKWTDSNVRTICQMRDVHSNMTAEEVEVIECLKCPLCGHSDDLTIQVTHAPEHHN